MPSNVKKYFLVLFLSLSVLAFSPRIAHIEAATEYELLAPIPLDDVTNAANPTNKVTPQTYIEGIVKLTIAAAGVIAVLKLIAAGLRYVAVDSFSGKDTAKNEINHALIGLILAIGAFTILNTISTQFTKLTISPETVGTSDNLTDSASTTSSVASCTNNCVPVDNFNFPKKSPVAGGCSGNVCVINQTLGEKLDAVKKSIDDWNKDDSHAKLSWQVTEMYPPLGVHTSGCHAPGPLAGSCVDASLGSESRTPKMIAKFLSTLQAYVSSSFQYELPTSFECASLKNASDIGVWKKYIVWNSKLQGGAHVHINLSGQDKQEVPCTTDTGQSN